MQPARLILEAGGLRYEAPEASNTVQVAALGGFRSAQGFFGCGLSVRSAWSAETETTSNVNSGFTQEMGHKKNLYQLMVKNVY